MTNRSAPRSGKTDLREERRFCDSDLGIRRDQALFRLAYVRSSLQQSRGQTRWYFGGQSLFRKSASPRNSCRVISQQNVDAVFSLPNLSFEGGNLSIGCVQRLLRL